MTKAKKKPTAKDAVSKFKPSSGDESYLNPPTKAGKEVIERALMGGSEPLVKGNTLLAKNAQLERALPVMADEINHLYEQGELMRRQTAETFIEVGRLLNVARKQFSSNTKFGAWRKKMIHFSQSHVQRLMQVATEFGDVEDATLLPFGTLAVLTNATEELVKKVIDSAKEGKVPTRAEVIEEKKADSPPESADAAAKDMETSGKEQPVPVVEDPKEEWEDAQILLDMTFANRAPLIQVEGSRNPFISACTLYGIPPFHDGHPSLDLVSNLYMYLTERLGEDETDLHDKLTFAHDVLQSVIKQA